jgi:hypothetical protein
MWLEVEYIPTSLFSFKDIKATNTAATSLLFPTPFAVKIALISEAIKEFNLEKGREVFELIKEKEIKYNLSEEAVVNKTFGRINDLRNKIGRSKPAYREYVYFNGSLKLAINIDDMNQKKVELLKSLFLRINYFGKKGSFMQFKEAKITDNLNDSHLKLMSDGEIDFKFKSIIQQTEDIPPDASFEAINIYNEKESLSRDNNERLYVVNIEKTLSGDGYQYYKILN